MPVRAGTLGRSCAGPGGLQGTNTHEEVALAQGSAQWAAWKGRGSVSCQGHPRPAQPSPTPSPTSLTTGCPSPTALSRWAWPPRHPGWQLLHSLLSLFPLHLALGLQGHRQVGILPHSWGPATGSHRPPWGLWGPGCRQDATAHLPGPGQKPALRSRPKGGRKGLAPGRRWWH